MAVTGPGSHIQASQCADPCRVADVTLAAAVRAQADAVYIEPMAMADDAYMITLERASQVLTTVAVDAQLGAAVIAVRSGVREAEVVITVRPGASLCADLMVMGVTDDPWAEAASLGLIGFPPALEIP